MGKVCVCGAAAVDVDYQARTVTVDGQTFKEGDWISIDGTTGEVFAGQGQDGAVRDRRRSDRGDEAAKQTEKFKSFQQLMKWCDEATRMDVRTNADTPEQTRMPSRSAPWVSACAAPSTCSSRATASTRCAR